MAMWTTLQFIFGLLLPVVVILLAYIQLFRRLRRLAKSRHNRSIDRPKSHSPGITKGHRMTKTVIVAVTTFIVCHMPYHLMQIFALERTQYEPAFTTQIARTAFVWLSAISQILVYVSSCCNPVIYGITNENFSEYNFSYNLNKA